MADIVKNVEYRRLLQQIEARILSSQIKAAVKVNTELLILWDIARMIVRKQEQSSWGDGLINMISNDLKNEFPGMKGFSKRNLELMRQWFLFWSQSGSIAQQPVSHLHSEPVAPIVQQLAGDLSDNDVAPTASAIFHIPWGHNIAIVSKCKTQRKASFYIRQTLEHNWSRAVLVHQIESGLIYRESMAVTNFKTMLPVPQSDLANQILKDPYCFDFLHLTQKHDEGDLEDGLMDHMTRFLMELGAGFAFVSRQFLLEIDGDEFFIDLLFYHTRLHCYVVVELKTGKFKPEFAGKLKFYVITVDKEVRSKQDNQTIGILICKSKNNTVVEYSLSTVTSPIGVSEYTITRTLPDELKSSLPTIEEIEAELGKRI